MTKRKSDPGATAHNDHSNSTSGRIVVVTGMSGAGHTTALRALEDQGFEAVDNLPLRLVETLVLQGPGSGRGLALGVDARTRDFSVVDFQRNLDDLRQRQPCPIDLLFIDCDDEVLRRRYTETRRRHPLAIDRPVLDGIVQERELLAPIRDAAEIVIDTSQLEPRDFGRKVTDLFATGIRSALTVFVNSFSYRYGVPRDADLVFDMRFIRNPYYEPELRALTGLDPAVGAYIEQDEDFGKVVEDIIALFKRLLPRYAREGKSYLTISFGCTGGQHRSVYMAEKIGHEVEQMGYPVSVGHRQLSGAQVDEDR